MSRTRSPLRFRTHSQRSALAIVASALLLAGACSRSAPSNADSALAHDLALAGQNQPLNPTFQDTAQGASAPRQAPVEQQAPRTIPTPRRRTSERVREAPQPPEPQPAPAQSAPVQATAPAPAPTPAPTPAPAPAAAPQNSFGAGTEMSLSSGSKVCTSSNEVGDKLVATVNSPVTGANGAIIPAGSTVVLEVTSLTPGDSPDNARITFRVRSLVMNGATYDLPGSVTPEGSLEKTKVANSDPNGDRTKVIGGAVLGGILGNVLGHGIKGTVIGAAAGAATGAVVARAGQKYDACLPQGAALRLTLSSPLVIT